MPELSLSLRHSSDINSQSNVTTEERSVIIIIAYNSGVMIVERAHPTRLDRLGDRTRLAYGPFIAFSGDRGQRGQRPFGRGQGALQTEDHESEAPNRKKNAPNDCPMYCGR